MMGRRKLIALIISFLLAASMSCCINTASSHNPAVLQVLLPAGIYVGNNTDPWLSECWLLNVSGTSLTFTVRINNTSVDVASYDTHLIIALNEEAYSLLVNFTVNDVTIPKHAFKNGTPTPYNLWSWPAGDVYPTWFNDTLVNLGVIQPLSYVDVSVSVSFSNATNVRIHFDAYGSKVPPPPSSIGEITHNPCSEDSTIIFRPARDIAVIDVIVQPTEVYAGQIVNITVAVRNNGNLTESFNVTTYYDNTPICTLSVTGLHPQEQISLLFTWNTTNVEYCNKTIKAEAEAVPDELDTSNNFYVIENAVKVKIPGDVNGEGRVDIYDIILIASIYGCKEDDRCWNPQADLAEPYGIINIYDVITAASHYGEKC